MLFRIIIVASFLLATALTSFAAEKRELHFGIISTESSDALKQVWEPLLRDMEKQTGYTIKAFFAPDYAGIVEAMRFGKVQLARYGNKSAIEAVDRASGEVFAAALNEDGSQGYYSHIIVRKDSPLNSIEDMLKKAKELTFGNGDPNSTSGYVVPGYYVFAQNGVDPRTAFKRTMNANLETNALSVASGQLDVATSNSGALKRLEGRNPEKHGQLKVIWTSPVIPSDPLVWRKDLPEDAKRSVKNFFLTYGNGGDVEKKVLSAMGRGGWKDADNSYLFSTRQVELFQTRLNVESDQNLSEQARASRLAELDAQLKKLQSAAQ